jgi:hypothetical protein
VRRCVGIFSPVVSAAEIKGLPFPEEICLADCGLVLNGTAVRTVFGFKVYVVGLYLAERSDNHEAIMTKDPGGKRVHISMLREVSAERFESTIQETVDTNFSDAEKERFASELKAFLSCFGGGSVLDTGSEVIIDFLPGQGMLVSVDGHEFDLISGGDFYHAILRLWLGKPPQESLKNGLLGKSVE